MPPGTLLSKQHVASYTILVEGEALDQVHADRVREVRVISSLASPDVCTLKVLFATPRRAGEPQPIDEMPFAIGARLEVRLGDLAAPRPTTLFAGEVLTLEPEFGAGGVELLVRAYDLAHRLFRARHVRTFQNQTASDIVAKVCREAGVDVVCESTGAPLEYMQQSCETDWDFIARLADRAGFEFVVVGGRAEFRRPSSAGPAVELEYPGTLFRFRPRVSAVQQVESVEVRAFDPATKSVLSATSRTPSLVPDIGLSRDTVRDRFNGDSILVATEPVGSQDHADQVAQALLDRMSNEYALAEGLTFGDPRIRGGATVAIAGVGRTFGGRYRVHTAIHSLRGGGVYETHFTSATDYTIAGVLGGNGAASPGFSGHVVLAKVTNNNDTQGLGRVRVWYPALGQDHEGTWARLATPSAGKERGLMMLPVPDEEVLVAFEHGDITRPYVIGSLFNGKDTPGDELADRDGSFGLRSDKDIVMAAKGDLRTTTDGKIEAKATKALSAESSDEVTLHAAKGMTVGADQALELSGGMSVSISTDGSTLKIEAPAGQLEISAANLKLSATGVVQISGTQIMLG